MGRWDFVEDGFDGFAKRDSRDHKHEFNSGKCVHCGKTREQLRSEW